MHDDDARIKRIAVILAKLGNPSLATGERRQLERELERLGHVLLPSNMVHAGHFLKPPIDVQAIYQRREELDGLFGL